MLPESHNWCYIAPPPSEETQKALRNARKERKRVQAKTGEITTTPGVLQSLQEEAEVEAAKRVPKKQCLFLHKDTVAGDNKNDNV